MPRLPTIHEVFSSRSLFGLHGLTITPRTLPDAVPQAVSMCLKYLGEVAHEAQVGDALGAPTAAGVMPAEIMRYVSGRGIRCSGYVRTPFPYILERIKQQVPSMVLWPAASPRWLIPCGYEPDMQVVVFADPDRGKFTVSALEDAERQWNQQPADQYATKVVLPFDRVSAGTSPKGGKHPLNRKTFDLQAFTNSTYERAKAAAVAVEAD